MLSHACWQVLPVTVWFPQPRTSTARQPVEKSLGRAGLQGPNISLETPFMRTYATISPRFWMSGTGLKFLDRYREPYGLGCAS